MAIQEYFIGSAGPFLYDDADDYPDPYTQKHVAIYAPNQNMISGNLVTEDLTTNNRLARSDVNKTIQEVNDLTNWLTGGSNVSITDDGDGTVTIAAAQRSDESIDDRVAALLSGGTNVTLSYDDPNNVLTINATDTTLTDEEVQDKVAAFLVGGTDISLNYDDANNTLTINSSATGLWTNDGDGSISYSGAVDVGGKTTHQSGIDVSGNSVMLGGSVESSPLSGYNHLFLGASTIMTRDEFDSYWYSNAYHHDTNGITALNTHSDGLGRLIIQGQQMIWEAKEGNVSAGTSYSLSDVFKATETEFTSYPQFTAQGGIKSNDSVYLNNGGSGQTILYYQDGGTNKFQIDYTPSSSYLRFYNFTQGKGQLILADSGNVGINKTPTEALDVNGNVKATAFGSGSVTLGDDSATKIGDLGGSGRGQVMISTGGKGALFTVSDSPNCELLVEDNSAGEWYGITGSPSGTSGPDGGLSVFANSAGELYIENRLGGTLTFTYMIMTN